MTDRSRRHALRSVHDNDRSVALCNLLLEQTMPHAIRFHQVGGPEVLQFESVTVGEPGPGEVRIRHTAIGLNYIDTYQRSGLYKVPLPSGLGSEAAGVVEAIGPVVAELKVGDRVAYS